MMGLIWQRAIFIDHLTLSIEHLTLKTNDSQLAVAEPLRANTSVSLCSKNALGNNGYQLFAFLGYRMDLVAILQWNFLNYPKPIP